MADQKYPSDAADRFQLRMPDGMRERISDAAERNNRSMNSEILARIEQSFLPSDQIAALEKSAVLKAIDKIVETRMAQMEEAFDAALRKSLLRPPELKETE